MAPEGRGSRAAIGWARPTMHVLSWAGIQPRKKLCGCQDCVAVQKVPPSGQGSLDRQDRDSQATIRSEAALRKQGHDRIFLDKFLRYPDDLGRSLCTSSPTRLYLPFSPRGKTVRLRPNSLDTWRLSPSSPRPASDWDAITASPFSDLTATPNGKRFARAPIQLVAAAFTSKMGNSVSWLSSLLWAKKEIRILILGLVRRPRLAVPSRAGRVERTALTETTRTTRERRRFCTGSRYDASDQGGEEGSGANADQVGEVVTTIPTIGFNVESVTYKNLNFNVWVRSLFPPPLPATL